MRSSTIRKPQQAAGLSATAPTQPNGSSTIPGETLAAQIMREGPLTVSQAARLYPRVRQGKPASPITVWRHILTGIKLRDGSTLKLEAARWGGKLFTSAEAIGRFLAAQQGSDAARANSTIPRSPGQRKRAITAAARELRRAGIR
jgi:hypothetical protein